MIIKFNFMISSLYIDKYDYHVTLRYFHVFSIYTSN